MTTIVCNRTTMVADKRATGGPMMKVTKMFRVNGSLIGVSGNFEQGLRFVEWRRTQDQRPSFSGDQVNITALELTPDGEIYWWGSEMIPIRVEEGYYAIGSGSPYALGALAMGASLRDAIKVAALWDECTGTEVQTMNLRGK